MDMKIFASSASLGVTRPRQSMRTMKRLLIRHNRVASSSSVASPTRWEDILLGHTATRSLLGKNGDGNSHFVFTPAALKALSLSKDFDSVTGKALLDGLQKVAATAISTQLQSIMIRGEKGVVNKENLGPCLSQTRLALVQAYLREKRIDDALKLILETEQEPGEDAKSLALALMARCSRERHPKLDGLDLLVERMESAKGEMKYREWQRMLGYSFWMVGVGRMAALNSAERTRRGGIQGAVGCINEIWDHLLSSVSEKRHCGLYSRAYFARAEALARCSGAQLVCKSENELLARKMALSLALDAMTQAIILESELETCGASSGGYNYHAKMQRNDPFTCALAEIMRALARTSSSYVTVLEVAERLRAAYGCNKPDPFILADRLCYAIIELSRHTKNSEYASSTESREDLDLCARSLPVVADSMSEGLLGKDIKDYPHVRGACMQVLCTAHNYSSKETRGSRTAQKRATKVLKRMKEEGGDKMMALGEIGLNSIIHLFSDASREKVPIPRNDLEYAISVLECLHANSKRPTVRTGSKMALSVKKWGTSEQKNIVRKLLGHIWDEYKGGSWVNVRNTCGVARDVQALAESGQGYRAMVELRRLRKSGGIAPPFQGQQHGQANGGDDKRQRITPRIYKECLAALGMRDMQAVTRFERRYSRNPDPIVRWSLKDMAETGEVLIDTQVLNLSLAAYLRAVKLPELTESQLKDRALEACNLIRDVVQGSFNLAVNLDLVTYQTLLEILCRANLMVEALHLLDDITKTTGVAPNEVCYNLALQGFAYSGDMHGASIVRTHMSNLGYVPNNASVTALLTGHLKGGDYTNAISTAQHAFNQYSSRPRFDTFLTAVKDALNAHDTYDARRALDVAKLVWADTEESLSALAKMVEISVAKDKRRNRSGM